MNWYKKAQINTTQEEIAAFLNEIEIVNEVDKDLIKVFRDSVVGKFNLEEHDSYGELITILNSKFNARFNYVLKNDDWFWIERIV